MKAYNKFSLSLISFLMTFAISVQGIAQDTAVETLSVVGSVSMISDMTQRIAGDKINIKMIVPIGGDPHIHEPTPKDASLVAKADLILVNGLTFEGWINELIANSGSKAKVVTVTKGVTALQSQVYANSYDPHAWMDVSNGLIYIKNIHEALVSLDPANKVSYDKNYETYKKELEELDQYITDQIRTIPLDKRVLITSHDAFAYYGKRYGIQLEALLGISTDAEIQTSDMVRVNRVIRERKVPAIFVESTINPKVIKQIATDNNIKIGGELYADSIGDKNSDAPSYVGMLRHNTDTIVKALGASASTVSNVHDHEKGNNQNLLLYLLAGLLLVGGLLYTIKKING